MERSFTKYVNAKRIVVSSLTRRYATVKVFIAAILPESSYWQFEMYEKRIGIEKLLRKVSSFFRAGISSSIEALDSIEKRVLGYLIRKAKKRSWKY